MMMARRASLQLKIHGKVVNTVALELEDLEALVELLRDATPLRPRDIRLLDLFEQILRRAKEAE
jgi:hypothetical protein